MHLKLLRPGNVETAHRWEPFEFSKDPGDRRGWLSIIIKGRMAGDVPGAKLIENRAVRLGIQAS